MGGTHCPLPQSQFDAAVIKTHEVTELARRDKGSAIWKSNGAMDPPVKQFCADVKAKQFIGTRLQYLQYQAGVDG